MPKPEIDGLKSLLEVLHGFFRQPHLSDDDVLTKAIEKYTYFVHPDVVAQTQNLPIIRARRYKGKEKRHSVVEAEFVSDNFPADYVFRAAMTDKRVQRWTQVSHIYPGKAQEVFFYTNLANLCLMPFWLAKLSDTNDNCVAFMKKCSYDLYGFDPLREFYDKKRDTKRQLKLANKVPSLFDSLETKKNQHFITAKKCGYIFNGRGGIDFTNQWVTELRQKFQNFPK